MEGHTNPRYEAGRKERMILFPMLGMMVFALAFAFWHTKKLRGMVNVRAAKTHIPTAIQALVLVAQAGEMIRVVEHVEITNIAAAGLLLAIMLATKSGTEPHMH